MQSQKSHRPGQKPRRGSYSSDSDHEHGNSGQKVYNPQPAVCPSAGIGYSGDPTQHVVMNANLPPNQPIICPPYKGPENQPVVCPVGNNNNQPASIPESNLIPICGLACDPNYPPQPMPHLYCPPVPMRNTSNELQYPGQPGVLYGGSAPYPTQGPLETGNYPVNEASIHQRTGDYGIKTDYMGYQDYSQNNYMPGVVGDNNCTIGAAASSSLSGYNPGPANNYQAGVPRF